MLAEGYELRPLAIEDAGERAAAYGRNREHLAPWDPVRPESFFTVEGQAADITRQIGEQASGKRHVFCLWHDGRIVGQVALDNVVRGVLQSGTVGYWLDHEHLGRGLATGMVRHVEQYARGIGMHRLEAGTMLHNTASQAVLRRAGFQQYGVAERFLFIGGRWVDHVLFQLILHDDPPTY
ncbi:GNAT family N-acetyltransferase [Nocardioides mangrovi]|uniref:GNAT family N-acetyltransferase n=1 Tax=Nocardioides mangrovi TaxID=2874580 RepID=A0ABS7UGY8_9ACTN|nr:GNAT family protein [Nocardioides mangrovi]MBZ5740275.1 GNAT family N-acetyltransferase [Nocardioides mangrovi]